MLPNFLVIGAPRSGTTSLHRYLGEHPDVYVTPLKETKFLAFRHDPPAYVGPGDEATINRWSVTSLAGYEAQFEGVDGEPAVGEASPLYLFHPDAPGNIHELVPDINLVCILRDPVERAWSDFKNMVRLAREPEPAFQEALDAEDARREAGWGPYYWYREKGFYHRHLTRFLDRFPREQLHITLFDDLRADPVGTLRGIHRFLGVDPTHEPDVTTRWNASGIPRSHGLQRGLHSAPARLARNVPGVDALLRRVEAWNLQPRDVPEAAAEHLAEAYREDVLALEELLDRDLTHWRPHPGGT